MPSETKSSSFYPPGSLAGQLYRLEQRKRAGDETVDWAYVPLSRIQYQLQGQDAIALAHLYASLDTTCAFGPSVRQLLRASAQPPPQTVEAQALDPTEAWGHAVLEQVTRQTADEVMLRLIPVLQANGLTVPPQCVPPSHSYAGRPRPTQWSITA